MRNKYIACVPFLYKRASRNFGVRWPRCLGSWSQLFEERCFGCSVYILCCLFLNSTIAFPAVLGQPGPAAIRNTDLPKEDGMNCDGVVEVVGRDVGWKLMYFEMLNVRAVCVVRTRVSRVRSEVGKEWINFHELETRNVHTASNDNMHMIIAGVQQWLHLIWRSAWETRTFFSLFGNFKRCHLPYQRMS